MSSYRVFEVDLFIKGKKFTHPVNVIKELNENIIGIDFIHAHKLTYDMKIFRSRFELYNGSQKYSFAGHDFHHSESKI
jgi:hypothetical protein